MFSVNPDNEPPQIDESKFRPIFGLFVHSDPIFQPYTHTEKKVLGLMREGSDKLSKEDLSYLRFNHYALPSLVGAAFGGMGALVFWLLDKEIKRQKGYKEEAESQETAAKDTTKSQEPGAATATSVVSEKEQKVEQKIDPLQEIKLSRKKIKGNEAAQKYDYFKAAEQIKTSTAAGEAEALKTLAKSGPKRYKLAFSFFFFIGTLHGFTRSRMNLYWKSKEYEEALKDDFEAELAAEKSVISFSKKKPQESKPETVEQKVEPTQKAPEVSKPQPTKQEQEGKTK